MLGASSVVVGDHCQLRLLSHARKRLVQALQDPFRAPCHAERAPDTLTGAVSHAPVPLRVPEQCILRGVLQNGVSAAERQQTVSEVPWPDCSRPMFFYSSVGHEEVSSSGTSYLNRSEAANVETLVARFLSSGVAPEQIGVVTPYDGQRAYIASYMQRNGSQQSTLYARIEVASVDAFQGREKDFIILSCVRSNEKQGFGF